LLTGGASSENKAGAKALIEEQAKMYNETEKTAVLPEFYDKWTLNGAVKMLPLLMGKNSEVMMTSEKKERKET